MDTKLKKFSYGLLWMLMLVSTVGAGFLASITAAFLQIYRFNLDPDFYYGYHDENGNWVDYESRWTGDVTDPGFVDSLTVIGLTTAGLSVAAAVLLILILVFTGRYGREEDGRLHLNWYDRIWSEIHIMSVFGFGAGFCGLTVLLFDVWACEDWFRAFVSDYQDPQYFGMPNKLAIALFTLAMTGSAIFCLTSLVSLVKKMKAHQFWEKSLIGGIWLFLWRGVRGSDRTTLKVMAYLLLLCAVAGFCGVWAGGYGYLDGMWIFFGAVICVLLIILVVPAKIRKFKAIRSGTAEIRSGNLSCKIPVKPDGWGMLDELDRLAVDLNHIGDAQQAAVASELKNQRMKTELISNVSHDLKTPLTSMSAYIDLLKKEGLDSPNAPEYLDIIDKKTQRLKVLTENLFDAAKASSGAIPVTIGEIDLAALVTQSLAEMDEKLSARGLTVIVRNACEGDPDGCRVMADGQLLWRIIENVLGNVSKYALDGSRVYVNLSKLVSQRPDRASKVLLEVKNISADPLNISADELMERFKRGDESRNTEGSGLGLAIAKDLAALMGGVFEISIDGDLFKACVVLDEAGSAQQIHVAESTRPIMPDFPSKSQIAESASEKKDAAIQAVRGTIDKVKASAEVKKAEKAAKKLSKLQNAAAVSQAAEETMTPLVVFEDIPVPEFETAEENVRTN
ncbi:MAG: HAMP domain-containing histidine kinase [Firmicutes bacterium]|nr:HAMP domain-containing histidine kinase [Bacillota bacterium]